MLRPITFSEYLSYKAILWNFQCIKRVDKHLEQDDVRKAGVERQNSKKGFKKNIFVVSDCTSRQYLKLACSTQKIQSLSKLQQVQK